MANLVRTVRPNGLVRPYTPTQISTWFFLPTLVLEFFFFVSPILPLAASIPCTIVFCGFAASSTYFGYMAMKIDPSDPRLHINNNNNNNNNNSNNNNDDDDDNNNNNNGGNGISCRHFDPQEPTKQCWICDIQVGEKSMHCKFCNKCVDQFDHHCMWLNTCIGKANYPYFFRTMVSLSIMLLIQAVIQIALILDIYLGSDSSDASNSSKERAKAWFGVETTVLPVVVVMGVFILFSLVSLSLIGQLLIFHLKLQREGITTYQFIVRDNQNRRERTKKENDLKLRRLLAVGKAKEECNNTLVFRLEKGGMLREKCGLTCCDPLKMEDEENNNNNNNNNTSTNNSNRNSNGANNETTSPSVNRENDDEA